MMAAIVSANMYLLFRIFVYFLVKEGSKLSYFGLTGGMEFLGFLQCPLGIRQVSTKLSNISCRPISHFLPSVTFFLNLRDESHSRSGKCCATRILRGTKLQ
jgi:hypothetical protein